MGCAIGQGVIHCQLGYAGAFFAGLTLFYTVAFAYALGARAGGGSRGDGGSVVETPENDPPDDWSIMNRPDRQSDGSDPDGPTFGRVERVEDDNVSPRRREDGGDE